MTFPAGGLSTPTGPDMGPKRPQGLGPGPKRWRQIALGFALGCVVFGVLRALEGLVLHGPCEGRTLWALFAPLLLGPGGIAYATTNVGKGRGQAALGVGLALSSLFPALALGVRDISALRTQGCAGGYMVFSDAGGRNLPQLVLRPGEKVSILARPGGFGSPDGSPPKPVTLSVVQNSIDQGAGVLSVHVAKPTVAPGENAPLMVEASATAPAQQYTLTVVAAQGERRANGELTVTVR